MPSHVHTMPTVTIQATGKLHKIIQIAGVLLMCAGPVACTAGEGGMVGGTLIVAGLAVWYAGRFTGWLFHG
jgi:hypothetical protein